ncbi:MAG: sialidase family protein [Bacteroidota bacterium]
MYRAFLSLFVICLVACQADTPAHSRLELAAMPVSVFVSGEDGYACFRIPAVITDAAGALIAFAEGRKNGCSDTGDIDLVMKKSTDGGKSWGPLQLIWDDGNNVCGNPAPVLDAETGVIHLLSTWNLGSDKESQIIEQSSEDTRHVYVLTSEDGEIWSAPREITQTTKLSNWTWYATGPGSGIQASVGRHGGPHDGGTLVERLMVACDHIEAESKQYYSHVIYSDDHGENWQLGGSTPNHQVNECEVVQLFDGSLMLNMRNYDRNVRRRQTAISKDGGLTWTDQKHDSTLIEPICQASLQSYAHGEKQLLLFSNPASEEKRIRMTVRASEDQGQSWKQSLVLHEGPSAYSDLVVMKDGVIGCLFEKGIESPYETISFGRIRIHE